MKIAWLNEDLLRDKSFKFCKCSASLGERDFRAEK